MKAQGDCAHDITLTLGEIGNLLDLSERQLGQLIRDGHIASEVAPGQHRLQDILRCYVQFLNRQRRENQRGAATSRLAAAQATRVELENLRRMGKLQTTDQVTETFAGLVMLIKGAHAGLPGRVASELASISDPERIHQRLQQEFRAIVAHCSDFLETRAAALEATSDPHPQYPPSSEENTEPGAENPIG